MIQSTASRKIILLMFVTMLGLLMVNPVAGQDAESLYTFYPMDCLFTNNGNYHIDCGYATMPENHSAPDEGQMIRLNVAILRSPNTNKAPDPILYLDGGPGGRSAQYASLMPLRQPIFSVLLQNRDVILVDQRGMGLSQPVFNCSPFRSPMDAFDPEFTAEVWIERMAECLPQFAAQGINWQNFNTRQNALDLSMIPMAMGYEKVNLFGLSYGTMLGNIILRENPTYVRSVLLDAVLAPDAKPFEQSTENFYTAFGVLEESCQADIVCRLAYPNLREIFETTYDRLKITPDEIIVDGVTVNITAPMFAEQTLRQMMSLASIETLPAFLKATEEQDFDVLIPFVKRVLATNLDQLPNQALYVTMVCPEGRVNTTLASVLAISGEYGEAYRAPSFGESSFAKCEVWGEILPFDTTMPESDIPTLLLSGDYDPLLSQEWAYRVAEGLSNSTVVEVLNAAHGVTFTTCGQIMAYNFFNNPEADVDTACVEDMDSPAFVLMTTVTRPPLQVATGLMSLIATAGIGLMFLSMIRTRFGIAWKASFRKMGWIVPVIATVLVIFFTFRPGVFFSGMQSLTLVQILMPLFMAMHCAAIFSPDDEPALEIQLASARPLAWLIVERLVVVISTYIVVGTIGAVASLMENPDQNVALVLLGWIPSAVFLSSVGFFVTVRSRVVLFGIVVSAFLWIAFGGFGDFFIPGVAFGFPLNLIQPFLWVFHLYPSLEDFLLRDFWLNRIFQTATSIAFIMYTIHQLRDTEQVLLNMSQKSRRKPKNSKETEVVMSVSLKLDKAVNPIAVRFAPLNQFFGIIWYELKMHWTKRGIKVLTLTGVAGIIFAAIFMADVSSAFPNAPSRDFLSDRDFQALSGEVLSMFSLFLMSVYLFMINILMADAVPTDKQINMAELLNAAPVPDSIYLAGKVGGAMLAVLTSVGFNTVLAVVLWWMRVGQFNIIPFVDVMIVVAIVSAISTGFAVLIGATQPSNLRALFLAVIFVLVPEFIFNQPFINAIFPGRVWLLLHNVELTMSNLSTMPIVHRGFTQIGSSTANELIFVGSLQLLITFILVWAWRRSHR